MDIGVDLQHFAKAMNALDDNAYDIEDIVKDIVRMKRVVFIYPDIYRTAKSDFMHNVGKDKMGSKEYIKCYDIIAELCERYGRRSYTFNTLVRAISQVKKTKEQVIEEVKRKNKRPPAFDKYIRATDTPSRRKLRSELEQWLDHSNDEFLMDLKSKMQKVLKELGESSMEIVKLTNGTTTAIEWNGVNINDILSVAFAPKCVMDTEVSQLGLRLKVANRYSEDDGFVYIPLGDSDIYRECGGDHIEIPDKDAKIREIYRMYPWIQVVSKKLHRILDKVARTLEGNYTYKHRDWIKNLVSQGWNRDKYIIGADMTKYSDTLDRSFIITLLKSVGFKEKWCDLIDVIYGKSIFDPTKIEILRDSLATFQGQYGDFPMITIANLVLQRFIYHKVKQTCKLGYNAAVGDDTGMIFDSYDPSIMDTMVEVYGCVGVNINRDKTGELIMGKGSIDFVKLEVDSIGVMEFLNLRSFNEQNTDSLVRDVLDLMTVSDEKRWMVAECLFGAGTGSRLADLSLINGGINDRPIEERDIILYVSRAEKLQRLQTHNIDDTEYALNKISEFLKTEMDEYYSYNLCDTPLIGYLTSSDIEECNNDPDKMDERIKLVILNMQKLGLNEGTVKNFKSWVGIVPSEARREWDKMIHNKPHDTFLAGIWSEIAAYETFAARRKSSESKKQHRVSYMLPVLRGLYDRIECMEVPDYEFYEEVIVDTVEHYRKMEDRYKAVQNTKLILNRLKGVASIHTINAFGYDYHYLTINTGKEVIQRRLYNVDYHSKYQALTHQEFSDYLAPKLQGLDISYEDMIMNFRESDYSIYWDRFPLARMGMRVSYK